MNATVHTSTAQQLYFAFLSRPTPREVGIRLPTITGEEDDISLARRVIKETQEKITRKYREVDNRTRKEQKVNPGVLVWIKREANESGVCKKLCVKWNGPFQVVEVLRDGGRYLVKEPFTGQILQRAAVKVKPFSGSQEYVVEPKTVSPRVHNPSKTLYRGVLESSEGCGMNRSL